MNFLFPTFLIGLTAIAIPIIIHLFNFRKYKKVYFTNVQFLKELKQESDSKSKLKEWLILLMAFSPCIALVLPGINGCAKANTKQAMAKIRAASTSKCFNRDFDCVSCFTSFKKRTLLK